MALAASIQITDQDVRSISATQGGEVLGQLGATSDGRVYAYGLAGSSNLSPGKLTQGAKVVSNDVNRTGVTTTAGQQQVTFTLGSTTASNSYYQGFLVVNAGTGAGQALRVAGNTAATAGSSNATTVNLFDQIITATASSDSKFSLIPNLYSNVVVSDHTAPTAVVPVGVPNIAVTAANYAWFQVGGECSVLANGTPGIGVPVIVSATTDGAVDVDTVSTTPQVGVMVQTAVSTEYRPCYLTILA